MFSHGIQVVMTYTNTNIRTHKQPSLGIWPGRSLQDHLRSFFLFLEVYMISQVYHKSRKYVNTMLHTDINKDLLGDPRPPCIVHSTIHLESHSTYLHQSTGAQLLHHSCKYYSSSDKSPVDMLRHPSSCKNCYILENSHSSRAFG